MSLPLTCSDLAQLGHALRSALAPLAYPTVGDWCTSVLASLRGLLGAATASFALPLRGAEHVHSSDVSPSVVAAYRNHYHRVDWGLRERRERLGAAVWTTAMLWDRRVLRQSEYWNDYKVPNRLYHALGLTLPRVRGAPGEGRPAPIPAGLYFHHDRPGVEFDERHRAMLGLVLPALECGVTTLARLYDERTHLARQLDTFGQGYLLCDMEGRTLHRNAPLERILREEPERHRLEVELVQLAAALSRLARGGTIAAAADSATSRRIHTAAAQYHLTGSFLGPGTLRPESVIAVSLEVVSRAGDAGSRSARAVPLTAREHEVMHLIARGLSNADVAAALSISLHTARHHTERVMSKLGARSRAQVAALLHGAARPPVSLADAEIPRPRSPAPADLRVTRDGSAGQAPAGQEPAAPPPAARGLPGPLSAPAATFRKQ